MRLCASLFRRRRGPAGLRNPFSFLSKLRLVYPALRAFPCVRGEGWYHYPQRALRAAETPDDRLSKRLICRFLRSGGRSSPHDSYFLANTQNFLLAVPVANAFALWYDKFSKFEFVEVIYMAKHEFGIMMDAPQQGKRYDEYEPWKYTCISVDDAYLEGVVERLSSIDFYWHTLSVKGKGLAYYGVTLVPPCSLKAFIDVIADNSELSELKKLLEKALNNNKWVIHYGL